MLQREAGLLTVSELHDRGFWSDSRHFTARLVLACTLSRFVVVPGLLTDDQSQKEASNRAHML